MRTDIPKGDTMGVVMDGREAQGRCVMCGSDRFRATCPECGYDPHDGKVHEAFMAGDLGSHDLLSDYGYPFDRFDDTDGA